MHERGNLLPGILRYFLRVCVCVCMSPPLEGLFSHSDVRQISVIIQTGIWPCHSPILIPVYLTEHFTRRV